MSLVNKKYRYIFLVYLFTTSICANRPSGIDHLKATGKGMLAVLGGAIVGGALSSKTNNELVGAVGGGLLAIAADYYCWGGKDDLCAANRQLGYAVALLCAAKSCDIQIKGKLQPLPQNQDALYADTDAIMKKHPKSNRNACVKFKTIYFAYKKNNQLLDVTSQQSIDYALQQENIMGAVNYIDSIYPLTIAYIGGYKIWIDDPLAAKQIRDLLSATNKMRRPIGQLVSMANVDKDSVLYCDTNKVKSEFGLTSYDAIKFKIIYFAHRKNSQSSSGNISDNIPHFGLQGPSKNTHSFDKQEPKFRGALDAKFIEAVDAIDFIDTVPAACIGNHTILLDEPKAAEQIIDAWQLITGRKRKNLVEGKSYMISPHNR